MATIFNAQFTELPQMKPSILFQKPKTTDGHTQIHHIQDHWVVFHLSHNEVQVYDSLNPIKISDKLQKQMQLLYSNKTIRCTLAVNIVHIPNLVDCGLFTIANATALAFGEAPEENVYDEGEMRQHMSNCFKAQVFQPFKCNIQGTFNLN